MGVRVCVGLGCGWVGVPVRPRRGDTRVGHRGGGSTTMAVTTVDTSTTTGNAISKSPDAYHYTCPPYWGCHRRWRWHPRAPTPTCSLRAGMGDGGRRDAVFVPNEAQELLLASVVLLQ